MSQSVNCIFCQKDCQATDEHIVPEFAGGSLTIKEVCKDCNSKWVAILKALYLVQ